MLIDELRTLAEKYLILGGQRTVSASKDGVRVTNFEPEPDAAAAFWDQNIQTLDVQDLHNLHLLLPPSRTR